MKAITNAWALREVYFDENGEPGMHREPEQAQPVAWRWKERINGELDSWVVTSSEPPPYAVEKQPLYTAPPQRQWVDLTADEIWQCNVAPAGHHVECHICVAHQNVLDFAEVIEAKLKEKNCG